MVLLKTKVHMGTGPNDKYSRIVREGQIVIRQIPPIAVVKKPQKFIEPRIPSVSKPCSALFSPRIFFSPWNLFLLRVSPQNLVILNQTITIANSSQRSVSSTNIRHQDQPDKQLVLANRCKYA